MRKPTLFLLVFIVLLFNACGKKNSMDDDYYVDADELELGEQLLCLDGFDTMDSFQRNISNINYTCGYNKDCFFCIDISVGFKLDFNTGYIGEYCDIPGCTHGLDSPDCRYLKRGLDEIWTADGCYESSYSDGSLYYTENGGKRKKIYENTYFNEYNEKYEPDNKTAMGVSIKGDKAVLSGTYWIRMLSLDTMETTEPIDFESSIMYMDLLGEDVFVINSDYEMIRYDMSNGESQKLADKAYSLMCAGNYVYFIKDSHLYRMSADGAGEAEILLEDEIAQFYVSDSRIFYMIYADYGEEEEESEIGITSEEKKGDCGGLYMCDLDGNGSQELDLSLSYKNGTEYKVEEQWVHEFDFVSCESIRYLFIADNSDIVDEMNENALFIVDKETGKVITVSLGIFYQDGDSGEMGSILTY